MQTKNKNVEDKNIWNILLLLSFFSITSFFLFSSLVSVFDVTGQTSYNNSNQSYIVQFEVGNAEPQFFNVTISTDTDYNASTISLIPDGNKTINCSAVVYEPNGQADLLNASAILFNSGNGFDYLGGHDNNYRYFSNCSLDLGYGTGDEAYVSCFFNVTYYAFNGTWNCSIGAEDLNQLEGRGDDDTSFNDLISVNVTPGVVDYGTVNLTQVSAENFSNWTNTGNVNITLSLQGWAADNGFYSRIDGNAMNCTGGLSRNISVIYHRYNFSYNQNEFSDDINWTLAGFNSNYTAIPNLDSAIDLNLSHRLNDTSTHEALNETFWRIYAPPGVAGTCSGFVQVTASFIPTNYQ